MNAEISACVFNCFLIRLEINATHTTFNEQINEDLFAVVVNNPIDCPKYPKNTDNPTAIELPINSVFLILLNTLGNITKEANENRIAAYNEGSIVGAARNISLITAKFVDHTKQIPNTTALHTGDVIFFSATTDSDSNTFTVVSTLGFDFVPVETCVIEFPNELKVTERSCMLTVGGRGSGTNP